MAEPHPPGFEQLPAHARIGGKRAHQDEHRDHRQVVIGEHRQGDIGQEVQRRRGTGQHAEAQHTDHPHRDANRHPQHHQHEHQYEAGKGNQITIHDPTPLPAARVPVRPDGPVRQMHRR